MKILIIPLLAGLVAVTSFAAESTIPQITVFGTAVTEVQPDELKWQLSVSNTGPEIGVVAEAHSQLAGAALTFLKSQGLDPKDIQTSQMTLMEKVTYRGDGPVKEGYVATTEVAFTSKNLAAYRALWLGLSKLQGLSIRAASWETSKLIELQNSTRLAALQAAKTKAAAMAAALNTRIAEPLAITEIAMEPDFRPLARNALMQATPGANDDASEISPGTVPVRVRVEVSFRLIPN